MSCIQDIHTQTCTQKPAHRRQICHIAIYVNDLDRAIKNCLTYHFADDTNLLHIGKSAKKIKKQINLDLKHIVSWVLANKISLNKTKTELIIFRKARPKANTNLCIKLNGHKFTPSPSMKYLGTLLDEALSGKAQYKVLIDKLIMPKMA